MESFPSGFVAHKVFIDVAERRNRKLKEDLKALRQAVVNEFKKTTDFFVVVKHEFHCEIDEQQRKECYNNVKTELERRGFFVKGHFVGLRSVRLLISSVKHKPNDHKWNQEIKRFARKHTSSVTSRRSSVSGSAQGSALPETKSSKPASRKNRTVKRALKGPDSSSDSDVEEIPYLNAEQFLKRVGSDGNTSDNPCDGDLFRILDEKPEEEKDGGDGQHLIASESLDADEAQHPEAQHSEEKKS